MNRIYRVVWNRARRQWVAASEVASSRSRSARGSASTASPWAVALLAGGLAFGSPAGAQFVGAAGGNASGTAGGTGHGDGLAPGGGALKFSLGAGGGNGGNGGGSVVTAGGGGGAGSGGGGGGAGNFSTANEGATGTVDGGAGAIDAPFNYLGGGGGGGGGLAAIASDMTLGTGSTWTGGAGGNGAAGSGSNFSGGGGAGGGGTGVQASGNLTVDTGATVTGGAGGTGGAGLGGGSGGGGGGGGHGIVFSGGTLANGGTITGGAGGLGGAGSSNTVFSGAGGGQGRGGDGVRATAGSTVRNAGTISGGLSADGTVRANAVTFTGGNGTLIVESGASFAGRVEAQGGGNTFTLGGAVNGAFDLGTLGTDFTGFGSFRKIEASTWTLTGAGAQAWSVQGGTLAGDQDSLAGDLDIAAGATVDFAVTNPMGHMRGAALSGAGSFVHAGPNALALVNDNSGFSGSLVTNGPLWIGVGGNTGGVGTAAIANNAGVVIDRAGQLILSGTISGGGSLTQAGPGTTTLSGNNTYGGGTFIDGGTLAVTQAAALGSGDVSLRGGTLAALDDMTVAPGMLQYGAGQASTVTAATGKTLVLAPPSLSAQSDAVLRFGSASETGTVELVAGGLSIDPVGTRIEVAGGTLRAGSASLGVLTGLVGSVRIEGGATLDANGRDASFLDLRGTGTLTTAGPATLNVSAGDFAGTITGAANLNKVSGGTLILSGDNGYTGTTTITGGGTLQVGNGGNTGSLGAGTVTNNGALVFSRGDTVTVANTITGNGTFTQAGSGHLVLAGAHDYTGGTFVNAGMLSVNGSIVGNTTVNSGGTLGGSGTTGSIVVGSGGTLAPGNSIGTLTAAGDLTFAAGSTYRVEANAAGAADRVNTVGAGTITIAGGTVDVRAGGAGYRRNTRYTILSSAGATTGQFDSATTNLAFLAPTLIYESNAVLLNLQASDALQYASVARTRNHQAVANYLGSFANAPSNAAAADLIQQVDNLSAEQARSAFDSIAGSPHASASQVALALGRNFSAGLAARTGFSAAGFASGGLSGARYASMNAALRDPAITSDVELAQAGPARGIEPTETQNRGLWVQMLGSGGRIDTDGNAAGSRYRSNGFVLGYDQPVTGQWLAGAAIGHSRSWWNATSGSAASGSIGSAPAGVYARYAAGGWRVRLDATVSGHDFDTDRTVAIGTTSSATESSHRGREFALAAQVERSIALGGWQLRPVAGLRHARLKEDGFVETGTGGANLTVAERTARNTLLSAGMHFTRLFNRGKAGLELRAVASHLAGDVDAPVTASIAGQAGSFTAYGAPLKRDALTLGATVSGQFTRGANAYLDANYEVRGRGQSAFQFTAGVRVAF